MIVNTVNNDKFFMNKINDKSVIFCVINFYRHQHPVNMIICELIKKSVQLSTGTANAYILNEF